MRSWLLVYHLVSIIIGASSSAVVLLLYMKTRNARIPPYLVSSFFALLIVSAQGYYLFQSEVAGISVQSPVWDIINILVALLCLSIPRIGRQENPDRASTLIIQFFDVGAIALIMLLGLYHFVFKDSRFHLVIYFIDYSLLSLALLYFGLSAFTDRRETKQNARLWYFPNMLFLCRTITLAFLPAFLVLDFFGWLIPSLNTLLVPGLSALPMLLIVMSLGLAVGSTLEILKPVMLIGYQAIDQNFSHKYGLTKRETEIALLLLQCLSYKEIAALLFISPGTVRTHIIHIYQKTNVNNRYELSRLL